MKTFRTEMTGGDTLVVGTSDCGMSLEVWVEPKDTDADPRIPTPTEWGTYRGKALEQLDQVVAEPAPANPQP